MNLADRHNTGKPPMSMVDPLFVLEVAKVSGFGAAKYGRDNWLKGQKYSVVLDSLHRHLAAFELGHTHDKESNLHHLAHAACNLMMLLHYENTQRNPDLDDRMYKAAHP